MTETNWPATIAALYEQQFGSDCRLYFSPGRINILGEHVDYNDGFALPAAVDKGMYFAVAANHSDTINFYAEAFAESYTVSIHEVAKTKGWANYVLSVVNEFLQAGHAINGFNCVFGGDVPRGSGMSSSAAVEGGLAFALNDIFGIGLDGPVLAHICQKAEHGYPGVQCGIMDQFANMMGREKQVLLLDCQTLQYDYYPLTMPGYSIVLLNSGVNHSLASSEYNLRRQQCQKGLQALEVSSFRQVTMADIAAAQNSMEPAVYNRCCYVVQEIARAKQATRFMQQGNWPALGALLYDTHWGLSKLYEVSCPELDFLVEQAQQYKQILGARVMGGGFGGCTINIIATDAVATVVQNISLAYWKQFLLQPAVYTVQTANGTHRLA